MSGPSAKPLRVLGIGNVRSLNLLRWARHLADRGHEVHLVSDRSPVESDADARLTVHRLQELEPATRVPLVRRLRIGHALRRLAETLGVDLVHAHYLLPYGYWAARAGAHPLVVSPWGTDALVHARERGRGRSRASRALGAADLVVVNSLALERAATSLGADPVRIRRILWHLDPRGFAPAAADPALRSRLGWPENALVVVSLRNFRPDTNIDVLVRAFAGVVRAEPHARLLLAARAGPLRDRTQELADELGLGESVAFARVEPEELPGLVAATEVAVSIANSDSTPPSLLEAMLSGLPLVCGEAASIDEWVAQGDGAEIVPRRDVAATTEAILRLLRDRSLRERYGRRNERLARERVGDPGAALEHVYRELVRA